MPSSSKSSRQSVGSFMRSGPSGPLDARSGSQYFQAAIDFFQDKVPVKGEAWDSLWQGQHAAAFTVAGAMKDDLLCDLRQAVDTAISQGQSMAAFRQEFKSIVARRGWTGFTGEGSKEGMAWRAKVIYDTNVRQAYNAGRWQQLQQFDIWVYRHGDSRSPRPEHVSWNGLALSKDDPWWQTHFPQNGWGCKCRVEGYSKVRAKLNGIEIGRAPDDGTYEYVNKKTGEVQQVPKGIDPGFAYSVGEAKFGRRISDELYRQYQDDAAGAWEVITPGNWETAGRPNRLPARRLPAELLSAASSPDEMVTLVTHALGGDEKLFSTPIGPVLVDAASFGEHIAKDPGRARYLSLLDDALTSPQEVWQTFVQHKGTGRIELRSRFVTVYQIDKKRFVMVSVNASKGTLMAWTLISNGNMTYLNKQRVGTLLAVSD